MSEEYRDSVYWGAGDAGRWYKESIARQLKADTRWKGSLMKFVRYAVRFALENDKSLKSSRRFGSPGTDS
jgi:hypothetical protein